MSKKSIKSRKNKSDAPLLSVIIPVYNEVNTIAKVIQSVRDSSVPSIQIVVVDDCSTDGTTKILRKLVGEVDHIVFRPINGGKGAAIRDGLRKVTGEMVVIQDADLEYNPKDLPRLIEPIVSGVADVVYGSRFVGSEPHRVAYFWHYVANMLLTVLSNISTNLNLTDMETGYKVFKREIITSIDLNENGFGIEPEVTAKVAQQRVRIYEIGISYHGRTYEEGKKIGFRDFLRAVWVIIKLAVFHTIFPVARVNQSSHQTKVQ